MILKAIEVVKQVQLKGPSGGYVGNIINHQGSSGHELRRVENGNVIVTHPGTKWLKEIQASAIVAYDWYDEAEVKPQAKAK